MKPSKIKIDIVTLGQIWPKFANELGDRAFDLAYHISKVAGGNKFYSKLYDCSKYSRKAAIVDFKKHYKDQKY